MAAVSYVYLGFIAVVAVLKIHSLKIPSEIYSVEDKYNAGDVMLLSVDKNDRMSCYAFEIAGES